jgi:hypothetical protein
MGPCPGALLACVDELLLYHSTDMGRFPSRQTYLPSSVCSAAAASLCCANSTRPHPCKQRRGVGTVIAFSKDSFVTKPGDSQSGFRTALLQTNTQIVQFDVHVSCLYHVEKQIDK